jgi:hypothetical protein
MNKPLQTPKIDATKNCISHTYSWCYRNGGSTMKPAICGVCGTSALQSRKGDWLIFPDYKGVDNEELTHPAGLEWFCEHHLEAAKLLPGRTAPDAITELKKQYARTYSDSPKAGKAHWWRR